MSLVTSSKPRRGVRVDCHAGLHEQGGKLDNRKSAKPNPAAMAASALASRRHFRLVRAIVMPVSACIPSATAPHRLQRSFRYSRAACTRCRAPSTRATVLLRDVSGPPKRRDARPGPRRSEAPQQTHTTVSATCAVDRSMPFGDSFTSVSLSRLAHGYAAKGRVSALSSP